MDSGAYLAAFVVFDGMDALDLTGPYEVLHQARRTKDEPRRKKNHSPFKPVLVSISNSPVRTHPGLTLVPDMALADCPRPDVIVVPGGSGARKAMHDPALLDWLRRNSGHAQITASVCTGALILGAAELLDGLTASTHHAAVDELAAVTPAITVDPTARVLDQGRIITSGGVSSGLDLGLAVISRLLGTEAAVNTARWIEYEPGITL